jgi:DNA-binding MarR family transcriptional regulator
MRGFLLDGVWFDAYTSMMATLRKDEVHGLCEQVASECSCEGLRQASRAISKLYEAGYAHLDLTATQFAILVAVHLHVRAPLSRLAERLVLDRTSLYRAVKPLVRRKALVIQPGRDRRERVAVLTPSGQRLLAEAIPIWKATQDRFGSAVGPAARVALRSQIAGVIPAVQALLPDDSLQSPTE